MPVFGDGMERGKYLHHMYQISILAYRVPVWPVGGIRGVGSESDLFYFMWPTASSSLPETRL